jgi:hypothetical protein
MAAKIKTVQPYIATIYATWIVPAAGSDHDHECSGTAGSAQKEIRSDWRFYYRSFCSTRLAAKIAESQVANSAVTVGCAVPLPSCNSAHRQVALALCVAGGRINRLNREVFMLSRDVC